MNGIDGLVVIARNSIASSGGLTDRYKGKEVRNRVIMLYFLLA